MAVHWNF